MTSVADSPDWPGNEQLSLVDELSGYATEDFVAIIHRMPSGRRFTYETALAALPERQRALLEAPEQSKFAGTIMLDLKRAKTIKRTGQYVPATHPKAHGRPIAEWEKL